LFSSEASYGDACAYLVKGVCHCREIQPDSVVGES
jgi:hypothetical protein